MFGPSLAQAAHIALAVVVGFVLVGIAEVVEFMLLWTAAEIIAKEDGWREDLPLTVLLLTITTDALVVRFPPLPGPSWTIITVFVLVLATLTLAGILWLACESLIRTSETSEP